MVPEEEILMEKEEEVAPKIEKEASPIEENAPLDGKKEDSRLREEDSPYDK